MLAGENEKLQGIAVKANSAIALAIGVRQLAEQKANITTLAGTVAMKANALATRLAAGIYRTLGIAVKGASRSMKVLKTAIISTGVGALVVGLGVLISKLTSAEDKTDDLAAAQEKYNKILSDSLTEGKKQVALQEQLLRADTEAEKMLIKKKIAYEEEKAALDKLIENKVFEDRLNQQLAGTEIIIGYDINTGEAITKMAEATSTHNDALEAHIEKLNQMDKAYLELEKSISKTSDKVEETEDKIKTLTDKEQIFIENKINTSQLLIDASISEYDAAVFTAEGEIELMKHKLAEFELTEDEKLLLREEIANKELALYKMVADKKGEIDDEEEERGRELAEAQANFKEIAVESATSALGSLGALMKEGSAQQKAMALLEIGIGTAVGFINGLDIAQKSAKSTGPAAAFAFPIFYATQIAAVLAAAAQAKQVLSSAESGGGGGGAGAVTYTAPYVPESAAQGGGAPETTEGAEGPIQAYVVTGDVTNAQNVEQELQIQSSL